eukprot:CAMPEP_0117428438 /NCGR_PEP_ID=MMETSP0758-20121206/8141_1 /TAXON_ID=63605 /ORGANISM="Percolomonas cosmopolitus, Strain AE-1 (ATCC 50343)" /LENGTH=451 /DNA_ID=CAMNT_0005214785 /DNA_START=236 /DNA_END=1591 /DNA_ORIENTATION=-
MTVEGEVTDENVLESSFNVMFAFDECISLGFKEGLSIDQILDVMKMESQVENLHNIILDNKIRNATVERKKNQQRISKEKQEQRKRAEQGGYMSGVSSSGGIGSSDNVSSRPTMSTIGDSDDEGYGSTPISSSNIGRDVDSDEDTSRPTFSKPLKSKPKSMSLKSSKKKPSSNLMMKQLVASGEVEEDELEDPTSNEEPSPAELILDAPKEPIVIQVSETLEAEVDRNGTSHLDVNGEMFITVKDEEHSQFVVKCSEFNSSFSSKIRPQIDKRRFKSDNEITVKKKLKEGFPVGNPLKIMTWFFKSDEESDLPLSVSCWPSESKEGMTISVNYELNDVELPLSNVVIAIPLPSLDGFDVKSIEVGTYKLDKSNRCVLWQLDSITEDNDEGTLDIVISDSAPESEFFPLQISFSSDHLMSNLSVLDVVSPDGENSLEYACSSSLSTEQFSIV